MADAYTQIYIHIVFAVKHRQSLISPQWKESLHKYTTGIVQKQGHKLIAINSMPDHIHLFVGLRPHTALADLVRDIKRDTTSYINDNRLSPFQFRWQDGYGAFSYAHSQIGVVADYIHNQEEHHRKKTFKEEYLEFLEKFSVEYKEEYLFEWIQ